MEKILTDILRFLKRVFGSKRYVFFTTSGETVPIRLDVSAGQKFKLLRMELHLDEAPSDSEDFTVTLDAILGDIFDVIFYTRDLSVGSVVDIVKLFGDEYVYDKNDVIVFAYANTGKDVYGLRVAIELLED